MGFCIMNSICYDLEDIFKFKLEEMTLFGIAHFCKFDVLAMYPTEVLMLKCELLGSCTV